MTLPDYKADDNEFDDLPLAPPLSTKAADSSAGVARLQQYLNRSRKWQTGDSLHGYDLQELLGSGGMGTVFAAVHRLTGNRVAVKILDSAFVRQQGALRRFQKEGVLLAQANSPYITRLLEVCDDRQHPFIVTELVEGTTLGALLKDRGWLVEANGLQLAAQVAQGLVDIADLRIIHRDIKPDNILLARKESLSGAKDTFEFVAKLTDFGLARHTDQSQSMELTRENSVLGTPLYMSPEQFADSSQLDVRSDIYSLGATLFHMLSGRPPFPGSDIVRLAEQHRHAPPPDLRIIVPSVSDAISEVVRKCLQKRPDLRYQTAGELLSDLKKVINGEAISITVHPLIPDCDRSKVLEFRYDWDLNALPSQLWPYVSNTERLNRAIGLPAVRYTTTVVDNEVQTTAHVRIAGMQMQWQEHVFEWIESRRMGILREFKGGLLKWFTSIVEFVPTVDGRTKLIHRFQVEPRNWFGKAFVKFKFGIETPRSLTKVYTRIDSVLTRTKGKNPLEDAFEDSRPLSASQRERFSKVVAQLQTQRIDLDALLKLSEYAQHASTQEIGRMRPRKLSEQLQIPFEPIMDVFLHGTKAGMFELKWDVICPSCRIASQTYDLLQMVSDHEHCEACNVKYEVDFRNQVEAIFRTHPQLRKADTGKYCIGGPAHSPHVVAQTRIRPEESVQLGLSLSSGTYIVRSPQLASQLVFQVVGESVGNSSIVVDEATGARANSDSSRENTIVNSNSNDNSMQTKELQNFNLIISLANNADWTQPNVRLAAGQQLVQLHNGFDQEMVVRIERASPRSDALTAVAILALPLFRELFPTQSFANSQLATMSRMTLLQTKSPSMSELREQFGAAAESYLHEHLQALAAACSNHRGTWVKIINEGALMVFPNCDDAIACSKNIHNCVPKVDGVPCWQPSCGVATGEAITTIIGGQLDYRGETVEVLRERLIKLKPGEVVVEDLPG